MHCGQGIGRFEPAIRDDGLAKPLSGLRKARYPNYFRNNKSRCLPNPGPKRRQRDPGRRPRSAPTFKLSSTPGPCARASSRWFKRRGRRVEGTHGGTRAPAGPAVDPSTRPSASLPEPRADRTNRPHPAPAHSRSAGPSVPAPRRARTASVLPGLPRWRYYRPARRPRGAPSSAAEARIGRQRSAARRRSAFAPYLGLRRYPWTRRIRNRGRQAPRVTRGRRISSLHHKTTENRRGRDSNPRYGGYPVCRFSKPVHSATLPPLQTVGCHGLAASRGSAAAGSIVGRYRSAPGLSSMGPGGFPALIVHWARLRSTPVCLLGRRASGAGTTMWLATARRPRSDTRGSPEASTRQGC